MIYYKDGKMMNTGETEINKNNLYGYVLMEHDFPNDNEIHEAETYEEIENVYNYITKYNPERKIYIREITKEEFNRVANIKANMM